MKTLLLVVFFVLVMGGAFLAMVFTSPMLTTSSATEHTYILQEDFDKVRKVFVRHNPMDEILADMHGEILYSKFDRLDLSMDRLLQPNWEIDGRGYAIVRINHPVQTDLHLKSTIHIDKDRLHSQMVLVHPVNGILELEDTIFMYREGNHTRVVHRMSMVYGLKIPKRYHEYMCQEVERSVYEAPRRAEPAIRRVVSYYANKGLIIPLAPQNR